jgi:hypothetical protein
MYPMCSLYIGPQSVRGRVPLALLTVFLVLVRARCSFASLHVATHVPKDPLSYRIATTFL